MLGVQCYSHLFVLRGLHQGWPIGGARGARCLLFSSFLVTSLLGALPGLAPTWQFPSTQKESAWESLPSQTHQACWASASPIGLFRQPLTSLFPEPSTAAFPANSATETPFNLSYSKSTALYLLNSLHWQLCSKKWSGPCPSLEPGQVGWSPWDVEALGDHMIPFYCLRHDLTVWLRVVWNSWSSFSCLQSNRVTGTFHLCQQHAGRSVPVALLVVVCSRTRLF